ncbi:hypothetical protein ACFL01_01230, partial [Planctomycetota bacterium]
MGRTYVRCGKCGSEFRSLEWKEGLKCPGCQSDELIPVEYEDEDAGDAPAAASSYRPGAAPEHSEDEERIPWKKSPIVGAIAVAIILYGVVRLGSWSRGPSIVSYTEAYQCSKCDDTAEYSMNHS